MWGGPPIGAPLYNIASPPLRCPPHENPYPFAKIQAPLSPPAYNTPSPPIGKSKAMRWDPNVYMWIFS